MIILDTCVIRAMKLDSSEGHLLRAIQVTKKQDVRVPWMVLEERVAQLAIAYGQAHQSAAQALRKLQRAAPGDVPELGEPDLEAVREHWRNRLKELVGVLEMSPTAFRDGMFRESNVLPPAGLKKEIKTGARDVAIWLSAVEYAKAHPDETVYFVSSNTKDFTDGSSGAYPYPMDQDVEGLGDRFVHLPSLAALLELVAPPVEVSPAQVEKILPSCIDHFRTEALARWGRPLPGAPSRFPALSQLTGNASEAHGWLSPKRLQVKALEVTDVQGYRLGAEDWCIAVVRWQFIGAAIFDDGLGRGCCTWTTRILMRLMDDGPSPRILEAGLPEAPVDSQEVEWPTGLPDAGTYSRDLSNLMNSLQSSSRLEKATAMLGYSLQTFLNASEQRAFVEEERAAKIGLDVQADAAAVVAAAEGWDTDDGDDLWTGLE